MKRVPAIFFRTVAGNEPVREWLKAMVVLHGFIKKSRATPAADLALALANKRAHERSLR
jgi:phage-related protein